MHAPVPETVPRVAARGFQSGAAAYASGRPIIRRRSSVGSAKNSALRRENSRSISAPGQANSCRRC